MRGRRHKLAVSTFPFLAVLLCAMGSLILILLVMDRKAHQAAQARAQREAVRLAEESAQSAAAQQAEAERTKQQARTVWEEKRDALHAKLSGEQVELQLQMRKVRDQLGAIAARLRYEQDTSTELRHKVKDERGKIQAEQQLLLTLRAGAGQAATQSKESNKTLQRMTVDLLRMEQALKDLKAARKREQNTFSVVPYHGRRGEDRRPIYVECTAAGVIFHPERRAMPVTSREFLVGRDNPDAPPDDVRAEVERRIARQRAKRTANAKTADATPYLLLLVRPEGVNTYHEFQAVLKGLPLDFGYEFIDADWVLDFPADDDQPNAQPWMVATRTPAGSTVPAAPPRSGANPRPIGMAPSGAPGLQGIRTKEGGGAGQWLLRGGSASPAGSGAGGTAAGTGGSGALVRGGVPGGTGSSSAEGTTSGPGPPGNGTSGSGGSANSSGGVSGLAAGTGFGQAGPGGGQSPGLFGQPGGSGTSLAPSAGGGGNGSANGGVARGPNRGDGRGHPSALAPSSEDGGGGVGAPGEGGTPGSGRGAPGGYILGGTNRSYVRGTVLSGSSASSDSATTSLGPPQALPPGSPTSVSSGAGVSGSSGTGYPGGSNSGSSGGNFTAAPGTGSVQGAGGGTAGNGMAGNGGPGTGTAGSGAGGTGIPGSGTAGTGLRGTGIPGSGTPGGGGSSGSNSGSLAPSGVAADGRYAVARGSGGGGTGQPGVAGTSDSGGTSGSGAVGWADGGGPPRPAGGPPSSAHPTSNQPGAAGGAPGDGSASSPAGNGSAGYAAVDPLMPRQPRGLRPADRDEEPPPEDTPRRKVPLQSGGLRGSGDSSGPPGRFASPSYQTPKPRKPAGLRPAWVHGGRDWTIYVECLADSVKLYPSEKTFPFAQAARNGPDNPLVAAIRQMIDRRQSARRPGEPPYYPQVRLLVRPENVRTFLKVYPVLETLPVPKTRQNLAPDDDVGDIVTGANP